MDEATRLAFKNYSKIPKYIQIADSIINDIQAGKLDIGDRLPSVNKVAKDCASSRDTVVKAYSTLKRKKIIHSVKGQGYYVSTIDLQIKAKVLFLINRLGTNEMRLFNAFKKELSTYADIDIDIDIYNSSSESLRQILKTKSEYYTHFLVVPYFKDLRVYDSDQLCFYGQIDKMLNNSKILILGDVMSGLDGHCRSVVQNLKESMVMAFQENKSRISRFKGIVIVKAISQESYLLHEMVDSLEKCCKSFSVEYNVLDGLNCNEAIVPNRLYVITSEEDLVIWSKKVQVSNLEIGKDIGVISCNNTAIEDLLNVTSVSVNYENIGLHAANHLLSGNRSEVENILTVEHRSSI